MHKEQVRAQKLFWEKLIAGPGTADSFVKPEATFYAWSEAGMQKEMDSIVMGRMWVGAAPSDYFE